MVCGTVYLLELTLVIFTYIVFSINLIMEKKINLASILFAETDKLRKNSPRLFYSNEKMKESPEWGYFMDAMKEACKQCLELAAENAVMVGVTLHNNNAPNISSSFVCGRDDNGLDYEYTVDKQSILDTIKEVE